MIAVAGEALVDLVVSPGGQVDARPGGGPYNAARTLARLGAETTFLGRLADDGFGRLLRGGLTGEGVVLGVPEPSGKPSTRASRSTTRLCSSRTNAANAANAANSNAYRAPLSGDG